MILGIGLILALYLFITMVALLIGLIGTDDDGVEIFTPPSPSPPKFRQRRALELDAFVRMMAN